MASLNKVILIGNLVKDPELKTTTTGVFVLKVSIGVQRKFKTDGKYESDFIDLVAWRQTAEFIAKFFKKGRPICVVGSLQQRSYDKNGVKVYVYEVVVDEASFVDKAENSGETSHFENVDDDNFDDLPT